MIEVSDGISIITFTREEWIEQLEDYVQLGGIPSLNEAYAMLARGELDGTMMEAELKVWQYLYDTDTIT
jgi:hypothetical protein